MSLTNKQLRKLIKEEVSLLREATPKFETGFYRDESRYGKPWNHPECEKLPDWTWRVCISLKIMEELEALGAPVKDKMLPSWNLGRLKDKYAWVKEKLEEYQRLAERYGKRGNRHLQNRPDIERWHKALNKWYGEIIHRMGYDVSSPWGPPGGAAAKVNRSFNLKDLDPETAVDLDPEMQKLLDTIFINAKKGSKKK